MQDIIEYCQENGIEIKKYPHMIKVGHYFDVYQGKKRNVFNLEERTFAKFATDEDRFYHILDYINTHPKPQKKNKKPTYKEVTSKIKANPSYRVNFGKWKGYKIENIPLSYLAWCCDNIPRINNNIKKYVDEQLNKPQI